MSELDRGELSIKVDAQAEKSVEKIAGTLGLDALVLLTPGSQD